MNDKYCGSCKKFKNVKEFGKLVSSNDGLSPRCKACSRDAENRHILKNYEHYRQRRNLAFRKRYAANPQKFRQARKDYCTTLRLDFLNAYGNKCTCCGETEKAFLTLEHINRDGKAHRKEVGGDNPTAILEDLKRKGWPKDGYTILCFNCNRATWELKICPHQIN